MLWFDTFEIQPAEPLQDPLLCVERGPEAHGGGGCARLQARPGVDMVSLPFRLETGAGATLRLALPADRSVPVTVLVLERRTDRRIEPGYRPDGVWFGATTPRPPLWRRP